MHSRGYGKRGDGMSTMTDWAYLVKDRVVVGESLLEDFHFLGKVTRPFVHAIILRLLAFQRFKVGLRNGTGA